MAAAAGAPSSHIPSGGLDGPGRQASRAARQGHDLLVRPGGQSLPGSRALAREPFVGAFAEAAADRLALVDALLASQALRAKLAAEASFLVSLLGESWQGKKTVFRLIQDAARTVEELAAFDPHLNIERVLGIARDGTATTHGEHLEAGLEEVITLFGDAISFLDLDAGAIFQTNSLATIDLNRLSERAAKWAGNPDRFEEWARLAKADREARAIFRAHLIGLVDDEEIEFDRNAGLEPLVGSSPGFCQEADFWTTPERKHAPIVRDRSAAPASLQKLAMIAPSEIRAAMRSRAGKMAA